MFERITSVLTEPDRVFGELAAEAPRLGFAYLLVLLQSIAAATASIVALYTGVSPELVQAREMLDRAGVTLATMALAVLLVTPLSALMTWAVNWLVLRIGSGTPERLWETAAWSQMPAVVAVPIATAFGTAGVLVGAVASMLGILWCGWLVYTGVGRLSHGNAARATIVYCTIWLGLSLLRILIGDAGPPPPGGGGGPIVS